MTVCKSQYLHLFFLDVHQALLHVVQTHKARLYSTVPCQIFSYSSDAFVLNVGLVTKVQTPQYQFLTSALHNDEMLGRKGGLRCSL